jgi:hypothetical protein
MAIIYNQYTKQKNANLQRLTEKFGIQFSYGHREILLEYSKLDPTSLLTGILQHGVGPSFTLYSDWPTPRSMRLIRSELWVYSKKVAEELRSIGVPRVTAIGSPWLYSKILDQYKKNDQPSRPKFLVFPRHYTATFTSKISASDIREKISYWRTISGNEELHICLYWIDFLNPVWQFVAREEGVSLVCAGISGSSPVWAQTDLRIDFYKNLRKILDSSTHCIFESFTSAIFYANDLGKDIGIFQVPSSIREINTEKSFQMEQSWLLKNFPKIFGSFGFGKSLDSSTQELLGYDDLLSSENLARILHYRVGVIPKV